MTKDTFIQWTKSSYAYTNMTVDGLERYPGNKPGLMDLVMQSERGLRIKKLCDKYNVIYAGDTIYTKRKNYDLLYKVREELVDEFIVGPIQWTPIDGYGTDIFSFGISPFVNKRELMTIDKNIHPHLSEDEIEEIYDNYHTTDLSHDELSKILSLKNNLDNQTRHSKRNRRIFITTDSDNNLIYGFDNPRDTLNLSVKSKFSDDLSPQEFVQEVLKKHKMDKWVIPEYKIVLVANNRWTSAYKCVSELMTRICVSYPLEIYHSLFDRRIAFSYDDERYGYLYKHFSFFDIIEEF